MALVNVLGGYSLAQIAQMSLDTLLPKLPMLSMFSTDFSPEVAASGSSVSTRVATALSSASLATGYATNVQNSTLTAKTITLGDVTGLVVGFTDGEVSKSSINLMDVFIRPGINAVANDMLDDLFALFTNSNYSGKATVGDAAAFDSDKVADIAEDLTDANVPADGRFLIVKPSYFTALTKDEAVKAAYSYGGSEVIRQRRINGLAGLNVVEYTDIPNNSENLVGIAGAKQGAIIAARQPAIPQNFTGDIETVTDPDSGFTLQLRQWYSADDGVYYMSMASIWGVAVGNAPNIVRLVSA
jgi:hypothetical protein